MRLAKRRLVQLLEQIPRPVVNRDRAREIRVASIHRFETR